MACLELACRYEVLCESRARANSLPCGLDYGHFNIPGYWPSLQLESTRSTEEPSCSDSDSDEPLRAVSDPGLRLLLIWPGDLRSYGYTRFRRRSKQLLVVETVREQQPLQQSSS